MRGKKSYLARGGGVWLRRWWCCGGGRWRCLGSWTAAPRSGATLSNDGVTVFSSFPFLYFGFSPFRFVLSSLWFLLFSLLFFFCLCFSLLSVSLFFRSSLFLLLSLSFFPPFSSLFFGLFIEPKGGAFYGCTWGARAAAVGRPFGCSCRGSASCFLGRCAAGGRPVSSVGGPTAWGFGLVRRVVQRERGNAFCFFRKRNNQRKPFFFPPVLHVQGRKKEEQCRSKRHHSVFFFFLSFFT